MASKFTYDTNILRIREVFAINPQKQSFIEPYQIPMIYTEGRLKWWSGAELLSTIQVPSTSTSALDLLEEIQPGLSSLSTSFGSTIGYVITSTVAGLGTAGYVSTSYLEQKIIDLSYVYHYISATTLYDVIANLGNLSVIGGLPNPMGAIHSNYPANSGYVSTTHIQAYGFTQSSIGWTGANATQTTLSNATAIQSITIPLQWYSTQIVSSTQLSLDIFANLVLAPAAGAGDGLSNAVTFQTYCSRTGYNTPLGEALSVVIPSNVSSYTLGTLRLPFTQGTLIQDNIPLGYPTSLDLHFYQSNAASQTLAITTAIPKPNGVFVTLNNLN